MTTSSVSLSRENLGRFQLKDEVFHIDQTSKVSSKHLNMEKMWKVVDTNFLKDIIAIC